MTMQFGFMPGRSTTDATCIVRQLQEKFYAINKTLYMTFVDLEKALYTQACHLVGSSQARRWWGVGAAHTEHVWKRQQQSACWLQPGWRVQCESGRSPRLLLEPFTVHDGSGSPIPGVSYRMSLGKPVRKWPVDDHWIVGGITTEADPLDDQMEGKGLRFNMDETKVLISGPGLDVLQKSGKDPCGVCLKGVGKNSIFCCGCSSWIHKKCCGVPGRLKSDATFRCKRCTGQAGPIDRRLMTKVTVGRKKLEVVPSFCYLGDSLSPGGGCKLTTITRCCVAWGKFNELLPVLTSRSFPITPRGRIVCQEWPAPWNRNLGPNLIWLASPAT